MSRIAGTCSAAQRRSSGRPFITSSTTGVPVSTTACSSSSWRPGSSSEERDAASPIMFCHSPDHDHGDVGLAGECRRRAGTRRPRRTLRGPPAGCRRTCRTSTGTPAAPTGTPGAYSTRTSSPTLRPDAVQHGHRLVQVEVEDPGPEGVALGVGQRPDHRDRAQACSVERQQVRPRCAAAPPIARRRCGPPRGGRDRRAPRGPGPRRRTASSKQAQPQLRLQHAPHARVDRVLAHRAGLDRLGQVARRRGRRSPSPCPRRRSRRGRRHRSGRRRSRG